MNPLMIIRELYLEAGQVYEPRLHRIIALMLVPLAVLLAANNFVIAGQQDPGCMSGCPADYSLVGVWLIIVPITLMALANYHLVMKPTLQRKKRTLGLKNGRNGETTR